MKHRSLYLLATITTILAAGCSSEPLDPEESIEQDESAIIGGISAEITDFPFQVAVKWQDNSFLCGGVVINNNWILTARHCVQRRWDTNNDGNVDTIYPHAAVPPSLIKVGYGSKTQTGMSFKNVAEVVQYPNPGWEWNGGDVAMLRLSSALTLGSTVNSIPLTTTADASLMDPGDTATATGWGAAFAGGSPIDALQKVDLSFVSNTDAQTAYGFTISADQIGTAQTSTVSPCFGDSGGPLVVTKSGVGKVLAGIVSWSGGCAPTTTPSMFGRISSFESWINTIKAKSFSTCQTQTNLAASANNWQFFTFTLPAGVKSLNVNMSGGTGDADLYVRRGAQPDLSNFDCAPWEGNTNETCSIADPNTSGTWYVGVYAYTAYSGVTVKITRL